MSEQQDGIKSDTRKEPSKKYPPATSSDTIPSKYKKKDDQKFYNQSHNALSKLSCRLTFTEGLLAIVRLNSVSRGDPGDLDVNASNILDEYAKLCAHVKGIPYYDGVRDVRALDKKVFYRNDAMEVCIEGEKINYFLTALDKKLFPESRNFLNKGIKDTMITDVEGNVSAYIPIRSKDGKKILSSDYTGISYHENPLGSWDAPRELAPVESYIECNIIFLDIDGLGEHIELLLQNPLRWSLDGSKGSGKGIFTMTIINSCDNHSS